MTPGRATTRLLTTCLLLSAVLILGIIQWSFLPVLIQNPSSSGRPAVEVSPSHSAKFAAPSKFLLGDFLQPCLQQASLSAPQTPLKYFYQREETSFARDDQFLPHRQLRSPPSAQWRAEFPAAITF
jgi:hypothetical protein